MVTYFNKMDLVSFGTYLLSDERKAKIKRATKQDKAEGFNSIPAKERLKRVTHADLSNWLDKKRKEKKGRCEPNKLIGGLHHT